MDGEAREQATHEVHYGVILRGPGVADFLAAMRRNAREGKTFEEFMDDVDARICDVYEHAGDDSPAWSEGDDWNWTW